MQNSWKDFWGHLTKQLETNLPRWFRTEVHEPLNCCPSKTLANKQTTRAKGYLEISAVGLGPSQTFIQSHYLSVCWKRWLCIVLGGSAPLLLLLATAIFWTGYFLNEREVVKHILILDISSFHSCLSNFIVLISFFHFVFQFTYPPSLSVHTETMAVQQSCFLLLKQLDFVTFHRHCSFSICLYSLRCLSVVTWILYIT